MHRTCRLITATALSWWLAGCGAAPGTSAPPAPLSWRAGPGQVLLLGEVHDNAAQHALRLQALQALAERGARPALLMEPFDRERQAAIDAVQQAPANDASEGALDARVDALIDAGGRAAGWHWPFYRPYLRLALQQRWPVVAANVSRADTRLVIQRGLAATGFQSEVPADIARAQARAIEDSHCGAVDATMAARLANAQVARDQFMATQVAAQASRGAVLLAGNGHVRRDIGVPRWLPADLRGRSHAVGYLERGDDSAAAYDEVVYAAPQERSDPCATLRLPAAKPAIPDRPNNPIGPPGHTP